jgi:hypothetical protein
MSIFILYVYMSYGAVFRSYDSLSANGHSDMPTK